MTESRELKVALEAADAAGEIIRGFYRQRFEVWQKSKDQPVTDADLAADKALKSILLGAFPNDGWLSEETADSPERLSVRRLWVVDPIDGTKEFIRGIPEFSISIALVEDGRPIVGVIQNPVTGETFSAARGKGASLNGQTIRATKTRRFADALIMTSRREVKAKRISAVKDEVRVKAVGSTAYKIALVAAGRCDLMLSFKPKSEWDIAAGVIIVEEAGGRVTDHEGNPYEFNRPDPVRPNLLATNGLLHAAALRIIRDVNRRVGMD